MMKLEQNVVWLCKFHTNFFAQLKSSKQFKLFFFLFSFFRPLIIIMFLFLLLFEEGFKVQLYTFIFNYGIFRTAKKVFFLFFRKKCLIIHRSYSKLTPKCFSSKRVHVVKISVLFLGAKNNTPIFCIIECRNFRAKNIGQFYFIFS